MLGGAFHLAVCASQLRHTQLSEQWVVAASLGPCGVGAERSLEEELLRVGAALLLKNKAGWSEGVLSFP